MNKKKYTWQLPVRVVEEIDKLAQDDNRSTTSYILNLLVKDIIDKKGKEYADKLKTPN